MLIAFILFCCRSLCVRVVCSLVMVVQSISLVLLLLVCIQTWTIFPIVGIVLAYNSGPGLRRYYFVNSKTPQKKKKYEMPTRKFLLLVIECYNGMKIENTPDKIAAKLLFIDWYWYHLNPIYWLIELFIDFVVVAAVIMLSVCTGTSFSNRSKHGDGQKTGFSLRQFVSLGMFCNFIVVFCVCVFRDVEA